MKDIKLCRDCRFSKLRENTNCLRCENPKVNSKDAWALSAVARSSGSDCLSERGKYTSFFKDPVCGMDGKCWEPKE